MTLLFQFCLLVPAILAVETQVDTHNLKPEDIINVAKTNLKDIPSAEISKHILQVDDKDKIAMYEKKAGIPETIEIKPLENAITAKTEPINSKRALKKKTKKSKVMKRLSRQQKKALRKKNKSILKQLRKQQKNKRKQMQRRNKLINKGKKQMRNIQPNKLSEVIELILSHRRQGEASKLSTQHIRQHILDLINNHKGVNKVIKPAKGCPKPKIGKRKGKKLLRSLIRSRKQKKRPRKVIVLKGGQRGAVNKGRGRGKGVSRVIERIVTNKEGRSNTYVTRGKKEKVRSKVIIRTGNKKSKRNKTRNFQKKGSVKN